VTVTRINAINLRVTQSLQTLVMLFCNVAMRSSPPRWL